MTARFQHTAIVAGGTLYVGNDGGVYSCALTNHQVGHWNGRPTVGTDIGVFTSSDNDWSRLGTNLPNVVIGQLTVDPNGTLIAATHGRGIWTITAP